MKKLSLLVTILGFFFFAKAAYLENVPMTLTQPDGTKLECFASGDEFYNYLHDAQGFTIIQSPTTGFYVYADLKDGDLVPTDLIPGRSNPEGRLKPHLSISPEKMMERLMAWELPEDQQIPNVRTRETNHGTMNNIVIFIRFADDGELTNSFSFVYNLFNENDEKVSMQTYFDEVSYQQINIHTTFYPEPNGDVIVSYQDTQNRNYFEPYNAVTNPNGYKNDTERKSREHTLLKNAVDYINANNMIPSDLNVDYNNDGLVDNVCFVVKGGCGAWNDLLWPHKWQLSNYDVRINGKRVWVFNFQLADGGESYFGTSTMCHEMNHSLGAPDLYHYNYGKDLKPVGKWDLMESNATPPQHMGAYMKYRYGNWIDDIPEITSSGVYTLHDISSSTNNCYKIASSVAGQFYVLEYRRKDVEPAIPGSGLLIYRINSAAGGSGNKNYNGTTIFDEVYIYRPNGNPNENGSLLYAHFNAGCGRTSFDAHTNPNSYMINGALDDEISIYDISEAGETISFRVGACCDAPTGLTALLDGKEVTLQWNAVDGTESYSVYRSEELLDDEVNGTSYVDYLDIYGNFSYYVKSNCPEGGISMPSNVVDVENAFHGPLVENLNGDVDENQVTLTWTEPETMTKTLCYGTGKTQSPSYYDWLQVYDPKKLSGCFGMAVEKVQFLAFTTGRSYTVKLYNGDALSNDNLLATKSFTTTESLAWVDVVFDSPLFIDCSKKLWVVFHCDGNKALTMGLYDGIDYGDALRLSKDGGQTYIIPSWVDGNTYSIAAKVVMTSSPYTYNIYGEGLIAENQSGGSFSYTEDGDGFHEYRVTTNYFNRESELSNPVSVAVGSDKQFVDNDNPNWSDSENWAGGKPDATSKVWIRNDVIIDEDVTVNSLYINDNTNVTVAEGVTLTISDAAQNLSGADGLVIESDAALKTNAENLQATVKRDIEANASKDSWTGKWHFLSSPVAAASVAGFVNNADNQDYDLYIYDETSGYWYNEKADGHSSANEFYTTNGTNFVPGRGYLASYGTDKEMSFSGVINAGEISIPVTAEGLRYTGFNLIGNPYPCSIDWDAESGWTRAALGINPYIWIYNDDVDQYGAYQLGNHGVGTNGVTNVIASCQGFFVKAIENGTLKMNDDVKTTATGVFRKEKNNKSISIKVEGRNGSDEVMMCLTDEGFNNAEKLYSRNEAVPSLYLKVDNEKYSIVNVAEDESVTIPLGFEPGTTGKFTISSNSNVQLIDNLTGNVTDLSSSSYAFIGSNADNADRFLIRISGDSENDDFVYQNGDELIISGNGNVQVIDCLGRVVINETVNNGRVNVSGLNKGVYVVRMNGDVQKIVIK